MGLVGQVYWIGFGESVLVGGSVCLGLLRGLLGRVSWLQFTNWSLLGRGGYEGLARVCWVGFTGMFGYVWLTGWSLLLGDCWVRFP